MSKWIVLFTLCSVWLVTNIDFTAVNLALAPIAHSLHADLDSIHWVITAYVLCSGAFMTVGGRLGDLYGYRNLFIFSVVIFGLSSALIGFAPNMATIILGRIGQGIGLAFVIPASTALVYLSFKTSEKGMGLGFITAAAGTGMAVGPVVGGWLIHALNWRWIFFINIPICLLIIILAVIYFPKVKIETHGYLDIPGIITLLLGLLILLLTINQINVWGLISFKVISLLILAILLLIGFVFIENNKKHPLISLKILKNQTLLKVIFIRMCSRYIFLVFLLMMSLYLQNILGLPPHHAGHIFLATAITFAVVAPFAGKISYDLPVRYIIAFSCFIMSIGLFLLTQAHENSSILYLILPMALIGIAFGIHFPATNLAALKSVPPKQSALVTGLQYTLAFASASIGLVISSEILQNVSQHKLANLLFTQNIQFTPVQQVILNNIASGTHAAFNGAPFPKTIITVAQQGFMFGFHWVFIVCLGLALLALIVSLTLPKEILPKNSE